MGDLSRSRSDSLFLSPKKSPIPSQIPSYSMNLFHPSTASYLTSFFVDIVFIHRKLTTPEMATQCQLIFDKLSTIQQELTAPSSSIPVLISSSVTSSQQKQPESYLCQNNYIFEIPPSTLRLLTIVTALLCHPFQRDHQANYFEKLEVTNEMMETMRNDVERYHKEMIAQQSSAQTIATTNGGNAVVSGGQSEKGGGGGSSNNNNSSSGGGNGNSNSSTPSSKNPFKNIFSRS
jgi:uncharacterized membrane protein YgcG